MSESMQAENVEVKPVVPEPTVADMKIAVFRMRFVAEAFMEAVRQDAKKPYPWDPWEVLIDELRAAKIVR